MVSIELAGTLGLATEHVCVCVLGLRDQWSLTQAHTHKLSLNQSTRHDSCGPISLIERLFRLFLLVEFNSATATIPKQLKLELVLLCRFPFEHKQFAHIDAGKFQLARSLILDWFDRD